jgi:hypothetical protein
MSLLKKEQHRQIYFLGIVLLAASVPLSRYFMSVAQFILLGNWLLEGSLKSRIKSFLSNAPALVFSSIYLLHVAGLFFTSDWDYAIKDLRTKVPLLLLPLILSTSDALEKKKVHWVLFIYILAVLGGTLAGITILLSQKITDTREMSPFISHIRFSLNVCLAIIILVAGMQTREHGNSINKKLLSGVLLLWFLTYLYISQSFTGYFIISALALTGLIVWNIKLRNVYLKLAVLIGVLSIPAIIFLYLRNEYVHFFYNNEPQGNKKLTWVTPMGHWYSHDTLSTDVVNGHRVWLYVSKEEMRSLWNKKSQIPYDSWAENGLKIEDVLIRFLTSKGYRKDSAGISRLTSAEIKYIECGIADVEETRGSPLHKRLRKIFWEYQNYQSSGDPSGHSVMMRLEYWKASWGLIRQHPLTGEGTGDMNQAFNQYYKEHHTKLKPGWWRRSHNQYLSVAVAFGLFGLLWFLFALLYPPLKLKKMRTFLFGSFFIVLLLSMMAEDTIESQDGVTFAAFFYCFFLFVAHEDNSTIQECENLNQNV